MLAVDTYPEVVQINRREPGREGLVILALTTAGATEVPLLGVVGSKAVLYGVGAAAMARGDRFGDYANKLHRAGRATPDALPQLSISP